MIPTIHAAAAAFRAAQLTPVTLLEACLDRIDRLEPAVRAWVQVDRDGARADAERCAMEMQAGNWRGPLHGIPIGIKDIFDVYDMVTAAGSRRWSNSFARHDAEAVQRLRQAGGIFLGKTVTTQFASFDPPPTRNPWDLSRTPGGSSSGSAAAVACGMCLGALGSQTGGSITRPASFCCVASMKPTYGRVSLRGVVPLAHSMDHAGPMARCVRDLAILMETIAGPDDSVPDSFDMRAGNWEADCLKEAEKLPLLGRLRGLFESRADPVMNTMMDRVCDQLRARGFQIIEVALPASFSEVPQRHQTVMDVEAAQYHGLRFHRHPEDYDPCIRSLVERGLACAATDYAECKSHQDLLKRQMRSCFVGLSCLIMPSTIGPAPNAETTGNPLFNSPWSYTGLPVVSFPVERTPEGLPLAIQLVGGHGQDGEVLRSAYLCEQALAFEMPDVVI